MAIVTTKHQYVFSPSDNKYPIHVVGCGATGSRAVMALVELGLTNITVHDFDVVEAHNLANQAFNTRHIGMLKVEAMRELVEEKTGESAEKLGLKFSPLALPHDDAPKLEGVVFLMTDTMSSRREIYEQCIKGNNRVFQVIETRMASMHGNIYQFTPMSESKTEAWLDSLIGDDEGETSPCGSSITVGTTASIIANLAVIQLMHCANDPFAAYEVTNVFLKPVLTSGSEMK